MQGSGLSSIYRPVCYCYRLYFRKSSGMWSSLLLVLPLEDWCTKGKVLPNKKIWYWYFHLTTILYEGKPVSIWIQVFFNLLRSYVCFIQFKFDIFIVNIKHLDSNPGNWVDTLKRKIIWQEDKDAARSRIETVIQFLQSILN